MTHKTKIFLNILFWAVCIFIFCLVLSYCLINLVTDFNVNDISPLGSIVGAFGTIIASVTAIYLYSDWKEPFFLERLESYQKELRSNIREFKHSLVNFLSIIHYENNNLNSLNNGNLVSQDYKKRLNKVLNTIDDLSSQLQNYKSIVKIQKNSQTDTHLMSINTAENDLEKIFKILNKYEIHSEYIASFKNIYNESSKPEFQDNIRSITEKFHDSLSKYFEGFASK